MTAHVRTARKTARPIAAHRPDLPDTGTTIDGLVLRADHTIGPLLFVRRDMGKCPDNLCSETMTQEYRPRSR